MKQLITIVLLALTLAANAQEKDKTAIEIPQWIRNIKISGYGTLQYQAEDKESNRHNEFNLRLIRLLADGKIGDFDWRIQMEGSSNAGPGNPTVRLLDLYGEWVRHKELRIKVGQFKRAFSFENPTNPVTQGWYSYALPISNLVGGGDRTGEKSASGRDIGIQIQGDLFPIADGRRLLHYQIGVYNGEGINQKDKDNKKDIIGGLWVMPFDGFRIGVFGWTGTRGDMIVGTHSDANGNTVNELASIRKNRYAFSAEYDKDEYTFRAEYIHSQGWGSGKANDNNVNYSLGDKADGWYVFGIVPVVKSKLHAKARYNVYRDDKTWSHMKSMYEIGLNYFFNKRLQINAEYARVNERRLEKSSYNFFDVQLSFRF